MVTEASNLYEHLIPEIREVAGDYDYKRIAFLEKDIWINYSAADEALKKLHVLYKARKRVRMPNLLVIGPTNNGKSMVIEKFCRDAPNKIVKEGMSEFEPNNHEPARVLTIQMPSTPDLKRFYGTVFDAFELGVYFAMTTLSAQESQFFKLMKERHVRMLIIDEIHNLLSGTNRQQLEFLNVLRMIGNKAKIPLVCVGTKDAYLAIRSDPQLENRFEPILLPKWEDDTDYFRLLSALKRILPLKKESKLYFDGMSKLILRKSGGILGEIITLLRMAAKKAIESGVEEITEEIINSCGYNSPDERRVMFERIIA